MGRTDARRGWERRRRTSRSVRVPWGRRSDPPDEPPLDARDRAAIEAIRRELDLQFGQIEAQEAEELDEPRARRPWAFVLTLFILVLAVAAVVGVALHGRRVSSPPSLATPPAAIAPAPPRSPTSRPLRETPTAPTASAPRAAPPLPDRPAVPRPSEPKAPPEPPTTAAVGDATRDKVGSDGEKDATAEDDGTKTADAPTPPQDRRPAGSRELPPRVQDGPARAELPPLDYSKRRPSLPSRARGEE